MLVDDSGLLTYPSNDMMFFCNLQQETNLRQQYNTIFLTAHLSLTVPLTTTMNLLFPVGKLCFYF